MRTLHVISSLKKDGGGPSRSTQGLVAGVNRLGVESWLMALHYGDKPWVEGVNHFVEGEPFEEVATQVKPDIVHLHGIWAWELHQCAAICRKRKIPYVIAPRGMLEPWSLQQKKWKKRIARWLYQDRDLRGAAALHATAESEAEQFRKLGFKNPVIISPNGVNVPKDPPVDSSQLLGTSGTKKRRALFVSRMHPKKGVLELVDAFARLGETARNWEMELVYTVSGEFEKAYEDKVRARVQELGLSDKFIFTGALNDEEKWQAYARADLFVLPTYSENFGIVVAEALWAKVPVVTTKGTPWKDLEDYKCGWWIDIGMEPLINALTEAMALSPDELQAMGEQGCKLVEEKYTWDAVVKAMVKGYEEVLNGRA